jgi:4-diphosphocytidyl-2-C-methyl-D-erythritol kinase
VAPAERDSFKVSGPFAAALGSTSPGDNIVLRALDAARAVAARAGYAIGPLRIVLDKRLPVASGIGGGSADAAALLQLVAEALPALRAELRDAALTLGADVPMCLDGVPASAAGIGEHLSPLPRFPDVACLLVNPGLSVSTPEVFRHLRRRDNPPMPPVPAEGFLSLDALVDYLGQTRNDLEAPATELAPSIAAVTSALGAAGACFGRMSGSGATVFGLFDEDRAAASAAAGIAAAHPDWWVAPMRLKPVGAKESAT